MGDFSIFLTLGYQITKYVKSTTYVYLLMRMTSFILFCFNAFFLNDAKKQHIFAEICLYEALGSLPVMPSFVTHVLPVK
jgi:hypothetical protein